jgi:hypothetical protein
MKKIIRLTESDLVRIVKQVISEQPSSQELERIATNMLYKGPKPNEDGAKYCFTKDGLKKEIKKVGPHNLKIHKIEEGDTPNSIKGMTDQVESLKYMNPDCDINKPRLNDVILVSLLPGR